MKVLFKNSLGLLTFSIALGLVLPLLMMDGMFMDAVMYTAVGNNLANGYGSPWFLYYSVAHTTHVPGFFENPPLGYWMFAAFFKVFGSSLYVERFYVLLTFLGGIFLIVKTWKLVVRDYPDVAWLPVLLWGVVPLTFWAYTHNMMENTMTLFVLLAVIFAWKSATAQARSYLFAFLAGLCVFLAFMIKGFPGMYPLATVAVYWLVYHAISFRKMLGLTLVMTAVGAGLILLLFALPVSGESLYYYLFVRTLGRIEHVPVVDNRLKIVWDLIQNMLVPAILVAGAALVYRFKNGKKLQPNKQAFWFLLILGLCGVVPLCLTKVQRGFYLIPAVPLVAMSLAVLIARPVQYWQQQIGGRSRRVLFGTAGVLLAGIVVATLALAGEPKRNEEILSDVHQIGAAVGKHDTITAPKSITHHWGTKAYLMRYYFIQMEHAPFEQEAEAATKWLLMNNGEEPPFQNYDKQPVELHRFDLYKRDE